jgi:hypothetical protein
MFLIIMLTVTVKPNYAECSAEYSVVPGFNLALRLAIQDFAWFLLLYLGICRNGALY